MCRLVSFCSRARAKVEGLNAAARVNPPRGEDKHLLCSPAEVQGLRGKTPTAHLPEPERKRSDCTNKVAFDSKNDQFAINMEFVYLPTCKDVLEYSRGGL